MKLRKRLDHKLGKKQEFREFLTLSQGIFILVVQSPLVINYIAGFTSILLKNLEILIFLRVLKNMGLKTLLLLFWKNYQKRLLKRITKI